MRKARKADVPGVTIAKIWTYYDDYNKAVNDLSRQFSYAGIAIIWIFRVTSREGTHIPHELVIAGLLLVLCLSFDYLQAIVGSVLYEVYGTYMESRVKEAESFQQPPWLLRPMDALFYGKVASLIAGFGFIVAYLWSNVR
jgi:hypothetical protein